MSICPLAVSISLVSWYFGTQNVSVLPVRILVISWCHSWMTRTPDNSNLFRFSLKVRVIGSQLYKIKSKASYLINFFHLKSINLNCLFDLSSSCACSILGCYLEEKLWSGPEWTLATMIVSTQAHNICPI